MISSLTQNNTYVFGFLSKDLGVNMPSKFTSYHSLGPARINQVGRSNKLMLKQISLICAHIY